MDLEREFKLGEWLVTPLRGVLHGPNETRRLTPKSVDVLMCLVRRAGEVVERDVFIEEVWAGRAFSDDPLNKCIAELRRQLGDTRGDPQYIETIPKRGYRLIANYEPVGEVDEPTTQPSAQIAASKRWSKIQQLMVVALLVAVALLVWQFNARKPLYDGEVSMAVLPFEVLGTAQEYFAEGMHEELITELSGNSALAVKSRSISAEYSDTRSSAGEIADALSVMVLVTGSIRQEGDRVRVTARLIDPLDDVQLWSASFNKTMTVAELFSIQSEIASEIAAALQLSLYTSSLDAAALPTPSIDAYDHFMLGKYHYRRQLPGDMQIAVDNFEAAAALDPQFADAWDWLAYAYNHAATAVGHMAPAEAYPKARAAALRALEIEPQLATAVAILGYIRAVYDWDWVGAEADLRRALKMSPNDSGTVWSLAHVLAIIGDHDEAIDLTRDFANANPSVGRRFVEIANRLVDAGRYEEALLELDRARQAGAEPAQLDDLKGTVLFALGRLPQATAQFERAVDSRQRDAGTVARLAHSYAKSGRRDEALRLLKELQERSEQDHVSALTLATANAGLGDTGAAIDLITQAAKERDRAVLWIRTDPFFAGLRDRPDFREIVEEFGLPQPN